MPTFVPGRALSAALYHEVIAPALGGIRHADRARKLRAIFDAAT
jgi:hypothetical protein